MANNLTPQQIAICDHVYSYDAVKSASELPQAAADRLIEQMTPDTRADAIAALAASPPAPEPEPEVEAPKRKRKRGKDTPLDEE